MNTVIQVVNLHKKYDSHFSLTDINLSLNEGEFLAFVGNNGAGKTTLLRLISGLLKPTQGEVLIMDSRVQEVKSIAKWLGIVHQYSGFPDFIKVSEFFKFEKRSRGLDEKVVQEAIDFARLRPYMNTMLCKLSEGTRRKIAIIKSLLHGPKILLLDEPTVGVDPVMQEEIWEYLKSLKRNKLSAIIATNNLREVESLCDRVMFMFDGQVIAEEKVADGSLRSTLYDLYGLKK